MRVIMTGGTGLIGRAVAAALAAEGYEVVVLSRRPEEVRGLPPGAAVQKWDGRTAQGWGKLADGAAMIINLAGENLGAGRWTPERKQRIRQSRLDAGRAVVEAVQMAAHKPSLVVQASGVGYYGPRGDEIVTEECAPGNDFLASFAPEWEASTAAVEQWGVRRIIMRTGVVFSLEGGALPMLLLPFRFFLGGPMGSGRQWVSWIHIADWVGALTFLIQRQAQGVFNVCAPEPLTNRQLAAIIGRVMRRPSFVTVPAFALHLLMGEIATTVLTGQRVVPARLLSLGYTFRFPNATAALQDLLGKTGRAVGR